MTSRQITFLYATFPNTVVASEVAHNLLELRLVGCINIIPEMQAMYLWEGKICSEDECIMILKTTKDLVNDAAKTLRGIHPYDAPCIVEIPIDPTVHSQSYVDWIATNLQPRN